MQFQQLSRPLRTLRGRLTVWNTLVVLLAVIAALVCVREGLRYSLEDETDHILGEEARELELAIEALWPNKPAILAEMKRKAESHHDRRWHVRWLDKDRNTLYASEYAPPKPLPNVARVSTETTTWRTTDLRSVERAAKLPDGTKMFVRVGTFTDFIDADISRVTGIVAPVGLAIFLLAPLGGFLLAERAVEPLQQIIAHTEKLRPERLQERLKLRGTNDELDQLAQKINLFLDEIAGHLQRHNDFLANAAHELRSPLAAIQSLVEVTLTKTRSQEEYEELLDSIHNECQHLTQLVNQVLQLAEAEGKGRLIPKEKVPLSTILKNSVEMFSAVAEEKNISLSIRELEEVAVLGDPKALRQVVTNLIDNAIKFTPEGGTITASLTTLGSEVLFEVSDTGVGIPKEDLSKVFDRFYQADRARRRTETRGNGLGLSICQAIVVQHNGTITLNSEVGKGTTFRVTLPSATGRLTGGEIATPA